MKIKIFSTKGTQKYEHTSEATTWGQLKSEISSLFYLDSLTATENITKRDLSVDSAELPKQDFTLFLRPKATKLGAYSYITVKATKLGAYSYVKAKAIIKAASAEVKEWIKTAYNTDYTHLTTAQMNEVISRKYLDNQTDSSCTEEENENSLPIEVVEDFLKSLEIGEIISKALSEAGFEITLKSEEPENSEDENEEEKARNKEAEEIARLEEEAKSIFG